MRTGPERRHVRTTSRKARRSARERIHIESFARISVSETGVALEGYLKRVLLVPVLVVCRVS